MEEIGVQYQIFSDVNPDPDLTTVNRAKRMVDTFSPDVIIAMGGGSPMDAAKILWLMYEHPELKFEDLAMRFMDIRKRIFEFPELGKKAIMVAIPTTSGTGSEVTPFSIITDDSTGIKYAIADYALTPNMAIVDSNLVMTMPRGLCAASLMRKQSLMLVSVFIMQRPLPVWPLRMPSLVFATLWRTKSVWLSIFLMVSQTLY